MCESDLQHHKDLADDVSQGQEKLQNICCDVERKIGHNFLPCLCLRIASKDLPEINSGDVSFY